MLGQAGSMQRVVDVLRVGRVALPVRRPVRLSSVLVCGVVVFLCVGVGSAFGEESIEYRSEGIKEYERIADNFYGNNERETEFTEPPGYYVNGAVGGDPGGGDGLYEYSEECERGNIFGAPRVIGGCMGGWAAWLWRPEQALLGVCGVQAGA
jgi:hypothetical protein